MRHKDGRWCRLSLSNRVVSRDDKGFGTVAAGAATAVTSDYNKMEDIWGGTESDLLAAQEAAGIAAWAWDVHTRRLSGSPLFRILYGRGATVALSEEIWHQWSHSDDRAHMAESWSRALAGGPMLAEFRTVWPDGSVRWLKAQAKLTQDGSRLIGVLQDISKSKTREEQLLQSNDELERFAYIASHDLQEPLRAVISFGDLLARKSKDASPESKQYLDFIRQAAARMQTLVSDLLTFSRVMQADREQVEQVDCQAVLAAVLESMQSLIAASGAEIKSGPLPVIQANPQQMEQLFENLLSNALKFSGDRKPEIQISAEKAEWDWRFCFSDNGIGFEMIYATRIFEAFKRLHSRSQYAGSGIGLALCKKIVERHGGSIWAESELGVGSRFYFLIRELC